eukprot:1902941-Rhodomonas_salina.1
MGWDDDAIRGSAAPHANARAHTHCGRAGAAGRAGGDVPPRRDASHPRGAREAPKHSPLPRNAGPKSASQPRKAEAQYDVT